jgi:hypothetical protein
MTVTDEDMNEFTHVVADALATLLKVSPDTIDRNALNHHLECLLSYHYDVQVTS